MDLADNNSKYIGLRNTYRAFYFESYSNKLEKDVFKISYFFKIDEEFVFEPVISIPLRDFYEFDKLSDELIQNMVFHIGMVELISYWKAACPKVIVIKPFRLNDDQILWWKKLYFNGLGEFFYLNSIKADFDSFVDIRSESNNDLVRSVFSADNSCIVPVGGGKDSVVTLELLKKIYHLTPMVVNSRRATDECITAAGYLKKDCIEVSRSIYPLLLEMNGKGFLNGHTPFSALLAFISLLTAAISGKGIIALSNESSANESTIPGMDINHQYSKSIEFEKDFRDYVGKYIVDGINYHSFLRPLKELQIAFLFSKHQKYFAVFKSCNAGSKTDIWCCNCPKCLFAFIILSPFINPNKMKEIFGENLLDKPSMQLYFDQLIGAEAIKPFECIGTVDEVNSALCMLIEKDLTYEPYLLKYYKNSDYYQKYHRLLSSKIMSTFEDEHFLNSDEFHLLKNSLSCWNN